MNRSWIRNLFTPRNRPVREAARRFRPALEMLEDRITPSTSTIAFALASPTVQASTSAVTINLGTLKDTFVASGKLSNTAISINWGDGTLLSPDVTQGTVTATATDSTYTISGSHAYATAANYTVTVIDADDTATASAATTVNVTPVPPASGIAINLTSSINVPVSTNANGTGVTLGSFTDTNVPAGDLNNTSISIIWGDGSTQSGTALATDPPSQTYFIYGGTALGNSQVHNYATAGPYTVTVTVNDGVNSAFAATTVNVAQPSTISSNLGTTTVATTNTSAISLGTLTDTNVTGGSLKASAISIDWGDGSATDTTSRTVTPISTGSTTYSISGTHTYTTAGSYTVTVYDDDGVQLKTPESTTVNVVVLPSNTVNFNLLSQEVPLVPPKDSNTPTLGSFSDTNKDGYTSAKVNWGDGTSMTPDVTNATVTALTDLPGSYSIALDHTYSTFGTFTATVQVTDGTGTYSASTLVTVYSTKLGISSPVQPITGGLGASVSLAATLNDPASTLGSGQYAATVNWGDGTSVMNATVSGSNGVYTITASHTYSSVGTYNVMVTATRAGSLPESSTSASTTATITKFISATNWMAQLPGSLPLTDISLPGTHQSAAGASLLTELTGDQNLLSEAKAADLASQVFGAIAIAADIVAAATAETVIPVQVAAALADAGALVADSTASTFWDEYAASFGSPKSGSTQATLQGDAAGLAAAEGADAILDGLGVGFHTATAITDAIAEGEAWLNPFADAAAAVADVGAEGYDLAASVTGALGYFAAVALDYGKFEKDLDAGLEVVKQYQTQELSIADQLNSGIRSLDIRAGTPVNKQIELYNGPQDTGLTLQSVLNDATAFLQAHPGETIVMTLRSNEDGSVNSNFNTDLASLLSSTDTAVSGTNPATNKAYTYNDFIYTSANPTSTPDLGQVRGKIVIIPYAADTASVQTGSSFGWQPTQVVEQPASGEHDSATLWNDAEGLNQTSGLIPTDLGNPYTLYITNLGSESPEEKTEPIEEAADVNANADLLFGPVPSLVTRTTGIVGIDNPDQTLINDIIAKNNMPIMVTSDSDSDAPGSGSLRAAINLANLEGGVNTIEFASTLTGSTQTIDLQSDLPVITSDLFIDDTSNINDTNNLNINGGAESLNSHGHQVFQDAATHSVTEEDFVATDGAATVSNSYQYSVPVYVVPAPTKTTVTASANPAVYGQPLTFTATVTSTVPGPNGTPLVPTGMVQFYVDGSLFGSPIMLDAAGDAVVSMPDRFLSGASHAVEAIYSNSDGNFFNSINTLHQVVQQIAVEPDPVNPALTDLFIGSNGATSNDQITINPTGKSNTGSTGVQLQALINGVNTQATYSQSFNAIYMYLQGGNDTVHEANTLTIPTQVDPGSPGLAPLASNGSDVIQLGNSSGDSVTLGNGIDHVQIAGGINPDNHELVSLGSGNDVVQIGDGSSNTVTAGGGTDQVTIGSNNSTGLDNYETVILGTKTGAGNDTVHLGDGSGDTVTLLGTGNDQVQIGSNNKTGLDNYETVSVTAATANVQLGDGSHDVVGVVLTGKGNNQVNQVNIGSNNGTGLDNYETVTLSSTGVANNFVQLGDGSHDSVSLSSVTGNDQVNIGINNKTGLDNYETVVLTSTGAGNDNVQLGDGSHDAVTLQGTGSAQVNIGSNTTGLDSYETVSVTAATANVQLGDGSHDVVGVVLTGKGNNQVNIGSNNGTGLDSYDSVTLSSTGVGNNSVQLGDGSHDSVGLSTATGNDQVNIGSSKTGLDNYETVALTSTGAGNDNVQLGDGSHDAVTLQGTGNAQVNIGSNNTTGLDSYETVSVTAATANVQLGDGSHDVVGVVLSGKGNNQVQIGSNNTTGLDSYDTVTLSATGMGNNSVQLGDGSHDSVSLSTATGNDQVNIGSSKTGLDNYETIVLTSKGTGNENVQLGDGSHDAVTLSGTGTNQVNIGSNNNTGIDSYETISLGSADAHVQLGDGSNDNVTGLAGNDHVQIGSNNTGQDYSETVSLGDGNDMVQIGDGNGLSTGADKVTLGNGADNVQIGGGNKTNLDSYDVVALGSGNDQVQIGNGTHNSVTSTNLKDNVKFASGNSGTNNNTFTG